MTLLLHVHIALAKVCDYCSLTKESLPSKERLPTPYFWPSFLYRVKVCSNERPPRRSSVWLMECTHGIWEAHPQAVSISEVKLFELYFTEGYYKAAFHRLTQLMRCVLQAKLHSHGAIQSVVWCQDLTSKPLVTLLNVIVCHLPCAVRTCKVLRPWVLFHKTINNYSFQVCYKMQKYVTIS